jgi:sulfate adenylyltransferase
MGYVSGEAPPNVGVTITKQGVIPPHGGALQELIVDNVADLKAEAAHLPSWELTHRQVCDLELLLTGAFSPLTGFLARADYEAVCERMRLADGTLWPMPITLDVTEEFSRTLVRHGRVALRHPEGMVLSVFTVSDVWTPDRMAEARRVFGTTDTNHPGVFDLLHETFPVYVGGRLEGLGLPPHHTFQHLRHTPAEMRRLFANRGWRRVVAFQTRNPMHHAHVELTKQAAARTAANLLIQPAVGRTAPGDVDYFARVRCYQAVLRRYPKQTTMLSLLPLAMRMAGPREAVLHAVIRQNYGASHFIVGRNHAGPTHPQGGGFYEPYAAQELLCRLAADLRIRIVAFEEMVYVEDLVRFVPHSAVPPGARALSLSGTELRRRLLEGLEIPSWFSFPEVLAELRRCYPPRSEQGLTLFFTGLSGAGKSTTARALMRKLMEVDPRPVTLLDGDSVRRHLSTELGFSRQHRDLNVQRVGYVAGEITKNRGIAICALIAPYRTARRQVRQMVAQHGGFVEVYISTPLEVCEARDRKGLYARARAGLIKQFTGIDDVYEEPDDAEITIDTSGMTPEDAAQEILLFLEQRGFITIGQATQG